MSHLAHTVKLKTAMVAAGVTDLGVQEQVVCNAYVNAIQKYLFNKGLVFSAYTEEVEGIVYDRLNRWNNISPINGPLIIEKVRRMFGTLTNQAMDLGNFQTYPNLVVEGYDYRNCECYNGLVNWLFGEMVTNND